MDPNESQWILRVAVGMRLRRILLDWKNPDGSGSLRIIEISEFLPTVRLTDFQIAIRNSSWNIFFALQNSAIVTESTESINECWNLCRSTENCFWFSFSQLLKTCLLFNGCPEIDENENFVTSEVDCTYDIQGEIRNYFSNICWILEI